jgi:hypothetical protein
MADQDNMVLYTALYDSVDEPTRSPASCRKQSRARPARSRRLRGEVLSAAVGTGNSDLTTSERR